MLQLLQNLQKNVFAAIAAIAAIPSTSLHLLLADLLRRAVTLRRRHQPNTKGIFL
jgi:ABC-type maltose transport system permease subunit